MSIDKGFIKYPVYRGDGEQYVLRMFTKTNDVEEKIDVATVYEEIVMEVRTGPTDDTTLIKRLTLSDGDFVVSDTNVLTFNLKVDAAGGVYHYDIRFKAFLDNDYQTLIKGVVVVEDNNSRI